MPGKNCDVCRDNGFVDLPRYRSEKSSGKAPEFQGLEDSFFRTACPACLGHVGVHSLLQVREFARHEELKARQTFKDEEAEVAAKIATFAHQKYEEVAHNKLEKKGKK